MKSEATTAWISFVGKVDFNPLIDDLTEGGPVLEIAGGAVDLVDDHAASLARSQVSDHLGEHWSAGTGGGLAFFKPLHHLHAIALRVGGDGVALLFQGYPLFALPGRGDADVGEVLVHMCSLMG
jgi:hypothetical protein